MLVGLAVGSSLRSSEPPSHKWGLGRGQKPPAPICTCTECAAAIGRWSRLRDVDILPVLGRLPSSWELEEREPCVPGCAFWKGVSISLRWRSEVPNQSHCSNSRCWQGWLFVEVLRRVHFLPLPETMFILELMGSSCLFKASRLITPSLS